MTIESLNLYDNEFEIVIGIETHAQISSETKLFSSASTMFGAEPNSQVNLLDAGMPGTLPVINRTCVEKAVRLGLALNGTINLTSYFDRKNYFYPDLPLGYQISQQYQPIVEHGFIDLHRRDGSCKRIRLVRLHLECDAGKSLHDQSPNASYIDLNRSGIALMEIVSHPDLRSIDDVSLYMKKLQSLVRYVDACDGNMEQGNLRFDINVSLRRPGENLGTRVELKNLNSSTFAEKALKFEIARQAHLLRQGQKINQQTRLYHEKTQETRAMRDKEDAHDYRYFPEPDLPPLVLDADWVRHIRDTLPQLPDALREKMISEFHLNADQADALVIDPNVARFFNCAYGCLTHQSSDEICHLANLIIGSVFAHLNRTGLDITQSPVSSQNLANVVNMISNHTLSVSMAKEVISCIWESPQDPISLVQKKGWAQISDVSQIDSWIDEVMTQHNDKCLAYAQGRHQLFGFFVGTVMKLGKGQVNPVLLNDRLKEKLPHCNECTTSSSIDRVNQE